MALMVNACASPLQKNPMVCIMCKKRTHSLCKQYYIPIRRGYITNDVLMHTDYLKVTFNYE